MPIVVTLTPNPAVDISTSVVRVEPVRKLRCSGESRDPGGGGINVARVASRLGARAVAIYPAGGFTGQRLESLVQGEGVESVVVPVQGETREDLTVLDETTHEEYRFVLPGPHLRDVEWMTCLKVLATMELKPDFICASGSLPPGAPEDFYARVAEIAEIRGVRFALDTSGPALKAALRDRVHLIKPNLAELRELVAGALDEDRSLIGACRALIAQGRTEVVALTLGAQGALLVVADAAWRARPLLIRPLSTVGAGDSFLGAMVWALASKLSLEEAFRYGAAAGAAALLAPGTDLCGVANVRRFLPQIEIERIDEPSVAG
ncbi:MAG: 1-phosphofructokinase family hexose kinase [Pseudomonadota bacterium]